MNRALWSKAFHDCKWLLAGSSLLLFITFWIRVWITAQFDPRSYRVIFNLIPESLLKMFALEPEVLLATQGRLALAYDEPVVFGVISIWAIARGSDMVSGEVGRGTMEMILAQPVRRIEVIVSQACMLIVGCLTISASAWLGMWVGVSLVDLPESVDMHIFFAPSLNLAGLGIFLGGLAALFSSLDQFRSRTIGITVGIYIVAILVKLISRSIESLDWLRYATFLTAFEPQKLAYMFWPETLAAMPREAWSLLVGYNGFLIGVGVSFFAAAATIFCRRDLPAPL